MKNPLLTTLSLYLLTALILLAVLGRPVLLAAGAMNVPALTLVAAAGLLSGFLAGAYYALTTRPGGAGEAQSPTPPTELTEAEKRSLALWWDDEPVILDLPRQPEAWEIVENQARHRLHKPMPHGHAPVGDGPLAQIEHKALSRARAMGCTISDGGWITLPEHLRQPGEESMFVDLLDFSDYLNRTQVTS